MRASEYETPKIRSFMQLARQGDAGVYARGCVVCNRYDGLFTHLQ